MERLRADYPAMFQRCQESPGCFIHVPDPRLTLDVPEQEREAFWEEKYKRPWLRHLDG